MNYFSILRHLAEEQVDHAMTQKVKGFRGRSFAANEQIEVFGELLEVNGFKFLNLKLVGPLKVKTFKGCKLVFYAGEKRVELDSDTMEIDTDYSRRLSLGITGFDIDLEQELENLIRQKAITRFDITIEKMTIACSVTDAGAWIQAIDQPVSDDQEIDYTEVEVEGEEEAPSEEEKPFGEKPSSDPLQP